MAYFTLFTMVAFLIAIQCSIAFTCKYPQEGKNLNDTYSDYFLGTMNFYDALTTRRKRGVIWPWTFNHSLILFRGKIFEWGIHFTYYMNRRPNSCYINWHWGKKGTSKCSLSDIENWTRAYGKKSTYNLFTNNCHMFTNALAKYLDTNCER